MPLGGVSTSAEVATRLGSVVGIIVVLGLVIGVIAAGKPTKIRPEHSVRDSGSPRSKPGWTTRGTWRRISVWGKTRAEAAHRERPGSASQVPETMPSSSLT